MRVKRSNSELTELVAFRLDKPLYKKLVASARMYADGDVSAWIRHCIESYKPRVIAKKKAKKKRARKKKS